MYALTHNVLYMDVNSENSVTQLAPYIWICVCFQSDFWNPVNLPQTQFLSPAPTTVHISVPKQ